MCRNGLRVLVVAEDFTRQEHVRGLLANSVELVDTAHGREVWTATLNPYEAIVMDLSCSHHENETQLTLLRALKLEGITAPVIVLTERCNCDGTWEKFRDSGADALIYKPINDPRVLTERIELLA